MHRVGRVAVGVSAVYIGFAVALRADLGTGPFNVTDGVRWNASFAYLDPARSRANLTIHAASLVDRVLFEGRRAVGAVAGGDVLRASTVVLAAGACGTPAVLLRSGIGPEADLNALGIDVVEAVGAVGANLADHVTAKLAFEPTEELQEETRRRAPVEFSNGLIKARTENCEQGFDLQVSATGGIWPRPCRMTSSRPLRSFSSVLPFRRGPMSPCALMPWHFAQTPW